MKKLTKKSIVFLAMMLLMLTGAFASLAFSNGTSITAEASVQPFGANGQTNYLELFQFTRIGTTNNATVRARDRNIVMANVPSEIVLNNVTLTVTEVTTSGFVGMPNLRHVGLPDTVVRIHPMAFQNNPNLRRVVMPKVENIGLNAFANNPNLRRIVIPESTLIIANNILLNNNTTIYTAQQVARVGWAANWNVRSGQVRHPVKFDETPSLAMDFHPDNYGGLYAVVGIQLWNQSELRPANPIVIPAYFPCDEGIARPVLAISPMAFASNYVMSIIFEYSNNPIRMYSFAFADLTADSVEFNRDVNFAYFDESFNGSQFADATVDSILLPDTIIEIPFNMFGESSVSNLQFGQYNPNHKDGLVVLPYGVEKIWAQAFSWAYNLHHLIIPESVVYAGWVPYENQNLYGASGRSIIDGWNLPQTVVVPFAENAVPTGWAPNWAYSAGYGVVVFKTDLQFNIYYANLFGVANSVYNPLTFTASTPTFNIHAPQSRRQGNYIFAYWEWYVLDCVCVVHICDEYCDEYDCEIYYDYECNCYGLRRERVDAIPQGTVGHIRMYARWISHTWIYKIVSNGTGAFDVFVANNRNDRHVIHTVIQNVSIQDAINAINLDAGGQDVVILFG